MYTKCTITIGDEETESSSTCIYKEYPGRCNVGSCLAEAFAKADCTLSTLAEMMDALLNTLDTFDLDAEERERLTRALLSIQDK